MQNPLEGFQQNLAAGWAKEELNFGADSDKEMDPGS